MDNSEIIAGRVYQHRASDIRVELIWHAHNAVFVKPIPGSVLEGYQMTRETFAAEYRLEALQVTYGKAYRPWPVGDSTWPPQFLHWLS